MSLAWGGYQNGLIPQSALVAVGKDSFGQTQYLETGAARAYFALDAAFFREFHKHLTVNCGNRSLDEQKKLYAAYIAHPATNALAAYPGTSNHGWARAADFGSNTQYAGTPEALWLKEHGPEYGFHPTGYGFVKVEPWHYDWVPGTATASLDLTPIKEEDDTMLRFITRDSASPWFVTDGLTKRYVAPGEDQLLVDLGLAVRETDGNPKLLGAKLDMIPDAVRPVGLDATAIAAAVAPLLPNTVDDAALVAAIAPAIAKAVNDDAAKRLAQ